MTAFTDPSPFEGQWNITEAALPNGEAAYTGTLSIQRQTTIFTLDWDITVGRFVGLGLPLAGHLFVSCGEQYAGLGLALFQRQADGRVSIQWCTAEITGSVGAGAFTNPWSGTFAGDHQVVYYLPDGRLYGEWRLAVKKVDQLYELTWRRGDAIHWQGLGLDTPQGLAAGWYPDLKQLAFLDYRADPDDLRRLTAVWALGSYAGLGTEVLVRR